MLFGCNLLKKDKPIEDYESLYKVEHLLKYFYNDSAKVIIDSLMFNANSESYYGLRLKLAEATFIEQKQLGSEALNKTNEIIDKSANLFPELYVKSCLLASLIHEKNENKDHSLEYLNKAESEITAHKIDSLYPYFAIRKASWYRVFDNEKRAFKYVDDVIDQTPKYNLFLEQSVAYMVKSFLWKKQNLDSSLQNSSKSLEILKSIEFDRGIFNMYINVAHLYLLKDDVAKAKVYSDSAFYLDQKLSSIGIDKLNLEGSEFNIKSKIFKRLNVLDSALYYKEKEFNTYSEYSERIRAISFREIDEINKKEVENKLNKLKYQQSIRMIFIVSALLFALAVLTYFLFRRYKQEIKLKTLILENNQIINAQSEELKRIDSAKTDFFGNVSHELRTPLTLIMSPIETLLQQNVYNQEQSKLLKIVQEGARNLKDLVDQLLNLQKFSFSELKVNRKELKAKEFFELMFAQFESYADSQNKKYNYKVDIDEETFLFLDDEKIRQIVYNLLYNAFKYSASGDEISGEVFLENKSLYIKIKDTGKGISPDDLPHLFDRYFQIETEEINGGLGIGLAICKEYVSKLGGEILVESNLNLGTIFKVWIPVELSESKEIDIFESKIKVNPHKSFAILITEDNFSLRKYLEIILSKHYKVYISSNGEEALQILSSTKIDLLVTDVMMPIMDGLQLIQKVKSNQDWAHIPSIILSAKINSSEKMEGLQLGVDDYMEKPFTEQELLTRIYNLLQNYQIRKVIRKEYGKLSEELDESQKKWLVKLNNYLEKEYENLSIAELADFFAMSESSLLRQTKRITGLSPQQYIVEFRLQKSYDLLSNYSEFSVQTIAKKVGYRDSKTFSRAFKNRFGKLPTQL